LQTMMQGTDVEAAYKRMIDATKAYDTAKAELDKAKKALARAMYR
jgi:hypothetical protein